MRYSYLLNKIASDVGLTPGDVLVSHSHNPIVAVPPTAGHELEFDHKSAIGKGLMFGGGAALLAYLLSGIGKSGKKRSRKKRALIAALAGLGVGGVAAFGDYLEQYGAGRDFPVDPQLDLSYLEKIYDLPTGEGKDPVKRVSDIRSAALAHPEITPVIPVLLPGGQTPGGTRGGVGEMSSMFNTYFARAYGGKRDKSKENWQQMAFFNRRNTKQMRRYIQQVKAVLPNAEFDVKGYSYGGGGAIWFADIAGDEGMKVRHLTTYDPVYWFRGRLGKPKTTEVWDNYVPKHRNWRVFGDLGAINGGSALGWVYGADNHEVTGLYDRHHGIQNTPDWDDPMFNKLPYTAEAVATSGIGSYDKPFANLGIDEANGNPAENRYRQWTSSQADEVAPGSFRPARQLLADLLAKLKTLAFAAPVKMRGLPETEATQGHRALSWEEQHPELSQTASAR